MNASPKAIFSRKVIMAVKRYSKNRWAQIGDTLGGICIWQFLSINF